MFVQTVKDDCNFTKKHLELFDKDWVVESNECSYPLNSITKKQHCPVFKDIFDFNVESFNNDFQYIEECLSLHLSIYTNTSRSDWGCGGDRTIHCVIENQILHIENSGKIYYKYMSKKRRIECHWFLYKFF